MSRDRMHWLSPLSRLRPDGTPAAGGGPCSEFLRDFDRIVFSSAFRRLQDKTQVFPVAKGDYVRMRLTHSLEVASVRRSLGVLAILGLLPGQFLCADSRPAAKLYARVLGITDFVSGMTDSYAVAVVAKPKGLTSPAVAVQI